MRVIAHHKYPERDKMEGVTFVTLEHCFAASDIVSLHCPLNEQNRGFVNRALLNTMKPDALLINTSRGALVNEQDLANALNNERIAGAGLDVLAIEPPASDHPLMHARHCLITPHIAWAAREARERLLNTVIENLRAFLSGRPKNLLN
jgi:glycerate dehydrogenase